MADSLKIAIDFDFSENMDDKVAKQVKSYLATLEKHVKRAERSGALGQITKSLSPGFMKSFIGPGMSASQARGVAHQHAAVLTAQRRSLLGVRSGLEKIAGSGHLSGSAQGAAEAQIVAVTKRLAELSRSISETQSAVSKYEKIVDKEEKEKSKRYSQFRQNAEKTRNERKKEEALTVAEAQKDRARRKKERQQQAKITQDDLARKRKAGLAKWHQDIKERNADARSHNKRVRDRKRKREEEEERARRRRAIARADTAGALTSQAFGEMGNKNIARAISTMMSMRKSAGLGTAMTAGIGQGVLGFMGSSLHKAGAINTAMLDLASKVGGGSARLARRYNFKYGLTPQEQAALGMQMGGATGELTRGGLGAMGAAKRFGVAGSFASLMGGVAQTNLTTGREQKILERVIASAINSGLKQGRWGEMLKGFSEVARSLPLGLKFNLGATSMLASMLGKLGPGFQGTRGIQAMNVMGGLVRGQGGRTQKALALMGAGLGTKAGVGFFDAFERMEGGIFGQKGGLGLLKDYVQNLKNITGGAGGKRLRGYMVSQMTGGKLTSLGYQKMEGVLEKLNKKDIDAKTAEAKIKEIRDKYSSTQEKAMRAMAGLLGYKKIIMSWHARMDALGQKMLTIFGKIQKILQQIYDIVVAWSGGKGNKAGRMAFDLQKKLPKKGLASIFHKSAEGWSQMGLRLYNLFKGRGFKLTPGQYGDTPPHRPPPPKKEVAKPGQKDAATTLSFATPQAAQAFHMIFTSTYSSNGARQHTNPYDPNPTGGRYQSQEV